MFGLQQAVAALAATSCVSPYPSCSYTSIINIPTPTPTSGCGKDHSGQATADRSTLYTINNGPKNIQREFLVHVPFNYNETKATGVVLSFHGNSKNMCNQEGLSLFSDPDYNQDWIAVYPQGLGCSWEGPSYHTHRNDDLLFVSNILATLRGEFCIDDNLIYASGKSNGGGFVGTIACDHTVGANFAAFAPVSGAFYTDNDTPGESWPCVPARPQMPILEFHGQNDTTIRYNGYPPDGEKRPGDYLPAIPNWLNRWATRDGCSSPAVNTTTLPPEYGGQVVQTNFSCSGYDNIVVGYEVSNWRHWWPTTNPKGNSDSHGYSTTIDATRVIMDFFKAWRKPLITHVETPETEL